MGAITHNELQELVKQLPQEKLPHAYRLLQELTAGSESVSPQVEFLRLPPEERRRRPMSSYRKVG